MGEFKAKRTGGPKCPNHGEELVMQPGDLAKGFGYAPCPMSGVPFAWEADTASDKQKIDMQGNITHEKKYKVTGEEKV